MLLFGHTIQIRCVLSNFSKLEFFFEYGIFTNRGSLDNRLVINFNN